MSSSTAPVSEVWSPRAPDDPLAVSVHRLSNGLQVWVSHNAEEPRFYASVVVRVGAGEDPPDATGMAHCMEHMLANKGTHRLGTRDWQAEAPLLAQIADRFDELAACTDDHRRQELIGDIDRLEQAASQFAIPNELKQVYAKMGGRGYNATTNKERTNYFVDLPAPMLERWMVLERDRFSSPVFRAFFSEVQTIIEEKNRSLDDAGRRSAAALDRLLWGRHPYATETLGSNEHLARPSVRRMERFFRDWVVPRNMALVVAGDVDPDDVVALAEQYFGDLADRPTPTRASRALLPVISGETIETFTHHGPPAVHVAWRTVPVDHPDRPALRMADMLLQNGKTGLLDTELNAAKKVRAAGAFPRLYRDGGAQVVWARPLAGQSIEEARGLVLEQVDRLRSGDLDPSLLPAIFLHWELGELAARESNRARAGWMTAAFVQGSTWQQHREELDRHRAVTLDDIARVARTYFGADRVGVVRRTGEPVHTHLPVPTVSARTIDTRAHSELHDAVLAMPVPRPTLSPLVAGKDWQATEGGAGTVFSNRNPHSDLCQLSWVWESGFETRITLRHALGLWGKSGTGDRSHVAFERWLYAQGLRVAARASRHQMHLTIGGPSEAVRLAVPTIWERWRRPRLDPVVGRAFIEDSIQRRQVDKTTEATLLGAARGYALYGDDATALRSSPSDDQLRQLWSDDPEVGFAADLAPFFERPRDLLYTGADTPEQLVALLGGSGLRAADADGRAPLRRARSVEPRVLMVHHASAKAHVTVYRTAGPHRADRLAPARLLGELWGGSAGLFFQELRESRALAYATTGGLSLGDQPGDDDLIWARAATHPAKVVTAATLLVELLAAPVVDHGRFRRAQASVVQAMESERINARNIPSTVRWWGQRGYTSDPRPALLEELRRLEMADVEQFRRSLGDAPAVVVLVGDLHRIPESGLAHLGKVEVLDAAELFSY